MTPARLFTFSLALTLALSALVAAIPQLNDSASHTISSTDSLLGLPNTSPADRTIDLSTAVSIAFGAVGNALSILAVYISYKQLTIMNAVLPRKPNLSFCASRLIRLEGIGV